MGGIFDRFQVTGPPKADKCQMPGVPSEMGLALREANFTGQAGFGQKKKE